MKNPTDDLNRYAEMGLAALIPGMVRMVELMQQQLDAAKAQLAALQGRPASKRLGRPPGKAANSGWAGMTPEQRSAEMKRRIAVARGEAEPRRRRKAPPKSEAGSKQQKLSKHQKALWAGLTPAQRKRRLNRLAEGRRRAAAAKERAQLALAS